MAWEKKAHLWLQDCKNIFYSDTNFILALKTARLLSEHDDFNVDILGLHGQEEGRLVDFKLYWKV